MANKEITVTQETTLQSSPAEMIRLAVSGKADLGQLEKLLQLQRDWEKDEARKAYNIAMSDFKANPPEIEKDKTVGYDMKTGGRVGYKHASLYNVTEKINSSLSKHGLSASWTTKQENGLISVTCKITHARGHSEETMLSAGADMTGSKNAIQAIGSTITYLQRYTLLSLTGLATYDDDDGQSTTETYIDDQQKGTIMDYLDNLRIDKVKFLKFMAVESIDKITTSSYSKAIVALQAKAGPANKSTAKVGAK